MDAGFLSKTLTSIYMYALYSKCVPCPKWAHLIISVYKARQPWSLIPKEARTTSSQPTKGDIFTFIETFESSTNCFLRRSVFNLLRGWLFSKIVQILQESSEPDLSSASASNKHIPACASVLTLATKIFPKRSLKKHWRPKCSHIPFGTVNN